ncbi:MAG: hypothetical protein HY287_10115 [Planctomycetes bacterium]|nr:hypothetical protein [Planctomycetota bacterium]MBI3834670.1 hypothetical protein [Planctomycetota bacterium]
MKSHQVTFAMATLFAASIVFGQTPEQPKAKSPLAAATTEKTTEKTTINTREEAADAAKLLSQYEVLPPASDSRVVETMLRKRVDNIDWTDKTFDDVLDWLREQGEGRVNIVPRWQALGIENVTHDSLVSLRLNNTTVADVLNEAISQLSEVGDIQYRGIGNKLTISTRPDFEKKMYVRVYNAVDILFTVPDFGSESPRIDLAQQKQSGGGSGGGGGQSIFSGSGAQQSQNETGVQAEQRITLKLTQLRQTIEQVIAPDSWDPSNPTGAVAVGGQGAAAWNGKGRIRVYNTSLIVLNTIEVHEMIAGLFEFGG